MLRTSSCFGPPNLGQFFGQHPQSAITDHRMNTSGETKGETPAPTTHNNEFVDILDRVFDNSHTPQPGGDVHGESLFDIPTYVRSSSSPPNRQAIQAKISSIMDRLNDEQKKPAVSKLTFKHLEAAYQMLLKVNADFPRLAKQEFTSEDALYSLKEVIEYAKDWSVKNTGKKIVLRVYEAVPGAVVPAAPHPYNPPNLDYHIVLNPAQQYPLVSGLGTLMRTILVMDGTPAPSTTFYTRTPASITLTMVDIIRLITISLVASFTAFGFMPVLAYGMVDFLNLHVVNRFGNTVTVPEMSYYDRGAWNWIMLRFHNLESPPQYYFCAQVMVFAFVLGTGSLFVVWFGVVVF